MPVPLAVAPCNGSHCALAATASESVGGALPVPLQVSLRPVGHGTASLQMSPTGTYYFVSGIGNTGTGTVYAS